MGIIKAVADSVGGGLADSWLEVIQCDMTPDTLICPGVQVTKNRRRGTNTKSSDYTISNGSVIHVGQNQTMILTDGGKVVDFSAEPGYYTVNNSSMPSMFNGELKASIKETFDRIKFGGIPSTSQREYYINTAEITGFNFGTPEPINYFDNFYNAELFLKCNGSYSIKITDPLKFFSQVGCRGGQMTASDFARQYVNEFLCALQSTIAQMSVDGIRISQVNSKARELAQYMSKTLDEDWNNLRGMEILSVAVRQISYDEESKKLINMRNKGAMMSDPTIREGFVQSSIASGLESAGSNTAGAGNAFMGMNMGMAGAGGFMQSASATNSAQMFAQQQRVQQQAPANTWKCACGAENTGKFCAECGSPKPAPANTWKCSCGAENTGKFCSECGSPKPADNGKWKCSCGAENTGKFCAECGSPRR